MTQPEKRFSKIRRYLQKFFEIFFANIRKNCRFKGVKSEKI
jgi:hypothetical protein